MLVIPTLWKLRQKDCCEFQVQPGLQSEPLPQVKERKEETKNYKEKLLLRKLQCCSWLADPNSAPPPSPLEVGTGLSLVLIHHPSSEGSPSPLPRDIGLSGPSSPPLPSQGKPGRPSLPPSLSSSQPTKLNICNICLSVSGLSLAVGRPSQGTGGSRDTVVSVLLLGRPLSCP